MFSLFNGIYDSYLAPSQLNLLIVGAPDSGKTAFLERLKVTEIPTRPRKGSGGNKTVQQRIGAEELTATLQDVLIETGAMEGRRHHRTSSMASFGENSFNNNNSNSNNSNNNNSIHKLSTKTTTAAAPASSTATGVATTTTTTHTQQSLPSPSAPSSSSNNNNNNNNNSNVQTSTGSAVVVTEKKRRFSICPAPERYSKSTSDEDDDFIMDDTAITNDDDNVLDEETEQLLSRNENSISNDNNNTAIDHSIFMNDSFSSIHTISDPPQRVRCHSKEIDFDSLDLIDGRRSSMQEIMLDHSDELIIEHQHQHQHQQQQQQQQQQMEQQQSQPPLNPSSLAVPLHQQLPIHLQANPSLLQKTTKDYDLKSKSKMLPLRMIRPTIGTNLAKIDMYGAKCHIFDVGGRLQDLWERYYDDCDAVIFCWKLGEDPDKPPHQRDDDDDDDDSSSNSDDKEEDDSSSNIYKEQQEMLNQVRNSIPDDVPFLIIGHIFGNASVDVVDRMYTTDLLLPRYHNPMTGFCCGSAKTGAGIKSSMEWLIPLAKRQQKERIAARRELELLEGGEKEL